MKLILAIIQDEDAPATIQALVDRGYRVTRIASTGGFLRQGNTTLLIGVETVHVPEVMELLRRYSQTRTRYLPVAVEATGLLQAHMIEVEIGGATIFVLDVERFETL
ncbi:MAG: cyclic-di-AMP receptor [Anaerolineae bacterium]|nr:cyclic-di-AMP receptor [Thermoflexus sp.]MDW8065593.1 cyclic-di-AMP receptor [Anaerolineae bacterium]